MVEQMTKQWQWVWTKELCNCAVVQLCSCVQKTTPNFPSSPSHSICHRSEEEKLKKLQMHHCRFHGVQVQLFTVQLNQQNLSPSELRGRRSHMGCVAISRATYVHNRLLELTYLIFVIGTTGGARGENICYVEKLSWGEISTWQIVMWKKFPTWEMWRKSEMWRNNVYN